MSESYLWSRSPSTADVLATREHRHLAVNQESARELKETVNHHLRTPLTAVLGHAEPLSMNPGCRHLSRTSAMEAVIRRCDLDSGPLAPDTAGRMTVDAIPHPGGGPGSDEGQPWVMPYTRRSTDDRDEAERIVTDLYLPHRLDLSQGFADLGMEIAGLRLRAIPVGRLTYGRRVALRTAEADHFR